MTLAQLCIGIMALWFTLTGRRDGIEAMVDLGRMCGIEVLTYYTIGGILGRW